MSRSDPSRMMLVHGLWRGSYPRTIDAEGRAQVPAPYRLGLDRVVLTRAIGQPCVVAYTRAQWRELRDRLGRLKRARRYYEDAAVTCSLDVAGGISVPDRLRRFAHLQHDVRWVGEGRYCTLWDARRWTPDKRAHGLAGILRQVRA